MRVARVSTNETCNQNCRFCISRREHERPGNIAARAVLGRVQEALAEGATEVVFTGGEPTLRRDLATLVKKAKQLGAETVTLETNAALLTPERATELRAAGLDRARIHLPGWGHAVDQVTRDPDGFEATLAGMRALQQAGVALRGSVTVARSSASLICDVPAGLRAEGIEVEGLIAVVPSESPDPRELLPLCKAAERVEALDAATREAGFVLSMDAGANVPPCLFPRPGRVTHLYTLSRGGRASSGSHRQVPACAECLVADRCPGVPVAALAREPDLSVRPIAEERIRRRLSVMSSVPEQIARELVTLEVSRRTDGSSLPMHTVRVNFACNQACTFCFVSTHLPKASDAAVEQAITEAGKIGAVLALSGGEPTLNQRLVDYVRLGKASGAREIELQTNATRLGDPARVRELAEAGVDTAFVSLHGSTAEISDAVTEAPGTFERTVSGIDELSKSSIGVRLNFVFCEKNRQDFPSFVRLVAERWPKATLCVSFVAPSTDMVPRERSLIPRYTDVLPSMAEGLRLAKSLGVATVGFESMCGLPLCLIPVGMEEYFGLADVPDGIDAGEFVKPTVCTSCKLEPNCYGLRRGYEAMYGSAELRPVSSAQQAENHQL